MKKIKFTRETIALIIIVILSAILNFVNLSSAQYNSYYAAAVKSMTTSFKNFFFVAFDPAGFVTIDKPPVGFWFQAISAKIFGFSTVSILLPSAIAGVLSVVIIYIIVKRAFGTSAGLLSALFLAITPVFVAVSRNNTIDNILIFFLLLSCLALSIAAGKGKFKYLILSMVLLGIGFNVKMLQAYLIGPALYVTYLLSTTVSFKKRIINLAAGTVILLVVSLSWALIVDAIPSSSRPYVDSSTNNTVMELIVGHNGSERFSLSKNNNGPGNIGGGGTPPGISGNNSSSSSNSDNTTGEQRPSRDWRQQGNSNGSFPSAMAGGGPSSNPMGGGSGLQGSFGGQTVQGFRRLFSKNMLSDQIVWFLPLAIIGFIATVIREKMRFKLDNKKKQSLMLWTVWFFPLFLYFSFNVGTWHDYYLTMLAPPASALAAIGLVSMWKMFKEGGWRSWILPTALIVNGAVQLLECSYFTSYSSIVLVLMIIIAVLSIGSSIVLIILNLSGKDKYLDLKKIFSCIAIIGFLAAPFTGSAALLSGGGNGSSPYGGLELLSEGGMGVRMGNNGLNSNTKLIEFLQKNKTSKQKYLLVVSNSNSASDIIINTGEPVMSIGGFLGKNNAITLEEFKKMVVNGEIRYVMAGGMGQGNGSSDIMNWVKQNGKLVSSSEYSDSDNISNNVSDSNSNSISNSKNDNRDDGRNGNSSQQLYDLNSYTEANN
ncbi:hypothetical protein CPAST_c26230 [Clostridium pasteurianum DSM 525 = ATCC 6013]|uniref:Uncharacterized protein n=1 Tax=Clostridium pasteurianum DSM 525 = ATCC 6013 TaxID=1262449 RepID=A0A0H3J430_CLOPA|nr:glycosyltransferase family 39 protein [Clostridium pasteurianum]AJA48691.1 hypothetical protein CPAST_c26230 [Clostridium pasteurianum DSM 525 = ATCC 6013]AJA52679.1 hypothetical protein CLPA_c26230 [Clostridium pasteurianum DSM 525 = ATCC 6013]AOZ75917.1 dolichyl-phosphate-mannose-protein mannosyltransferase [Clostridium pasteurianum DSM 525 = ATCC 6013]AOZ79713.1 dolichyl-phosphate-mannose-protein mannosyltransferase [Clostridium pasteurianum]ELP59990.1 hypothetical protein F502_05122 [Cl